MILVLLTPFASHIRKIKWGDFEAVLEHDIEKLKEQAEKLNKLSTEAKTSVKLVTLAKELKNLAERDKILAFAKLRIEIELTLKRLFTFTEKENSYSIRTMIQVLAGTEVITNRLRNTILSINSILNRVVHGEDIPTETGIDNVLNIGIEIINELDSIFYDKVIKPTSEKFISKKQLDNYMESVYEVTTIVPLVDKPYVSKRILNQEQLDLFLYGYDEYAEFLVGIQKI